MNLSLGLGGMIAGATHDRTGSLEVTTWVVCTLVLVLGGTWTVLVYRAPFPERV